jgi:S1-C subfamily serine protease
MRNQIAWILWFFLGTVPAAAENDHVKIAGQNAPAVVAINTVKEDGSTFTGTGFVLTPDGLIATSRHVIDDTLYMNITFSNGAVSGEAVAVAAAGNVDLALLKIQAQNLPTVHVADSVSVRPGQPITVIGNPRRLQNTVTSGLISQVRQKADGILWHQISAPISPSSSGSPVFNEDGEVISVAFASYPGENNQNLNFSVPSTYLLELVRKAGYTLPEKIEEPAAVLPEPENPVVAYLKRCWKILTDLIGSKGPART